MGISWFVTYDAQTLSYLQYIWHHLALKSTHAPIFWPLLFRKRHRNKYQHVPYSPSPIVPNIQGSASASILIPFSNSAAKWNGRFGCFLSEKFMQASFCIIPRLNPSQLAFWMVVTWYMHTCDEFKWWRYPTVFDFLNKCWNSAQSQASINILSRFCHKSGYIVPKRIHVTVYYLHLPWKSTKCR